MTKNLNWLILLVTFSGFAFYISAKEESKTETVKGNKEVEVEILDEIIELREKQLKMVEGRKKDGQGTDGESEIKREYYIAMLKKSILKNNSDMVRKFNNKLFLYMAEMAEIKSIEKELGLKSDWYEDIQFWFLDLKLEMIRNYDHKLEQETLPNH
jgi:hypothetical protein